MKVLITGASGFVGSHLIEYLQSLGGHEIFGTYRSHQPEKKAEAVQFLKVDLQNKDEVLTTFRNIMPEWVFHLAAQAHVGESFKNPLETITNNISGELNVLEALKDLNLQNTRVLIVSTAEVYGMVRPEDLPMHENTPHRPANPYAVSKIAQDYLAFQYSLSHNLDIIRVRPFNHIGPRQSNKFVVAQFASQIAEIEKEKREPVLRVGNMEAKRDFTDVRDIVRGYHLLMQKGEKSEVYNLGSGVSYSIDEILRILFSFSDRSIRTEPDDSLLRPIDTPEIRADITKITDKTGWKPEIPLEQTLKDTLEYWRQVY